MNPVEVAVQMKADKIAYYREAIEKCAHPVGRKMFQIILDDEEDHLEGLRMMLGEQKIDVSRLSPMKSLRTAVESMKDDMSVRMACTLDEMEAFRLAMEKEKEAYDFFTARAAEATDDYEKALFEKLAHEEDEHYRVFSNTYSFLDDTGNWFMWEEYSIVEG